MTAAADAAYVGAVLTARGVVVRTGATTILDGVDLDVRAGEVTVVVGPNGAGKSTLLSVLAGDVSPDAGSVLLGGTEVRRMTVAELARRRAVLLQENRLAFPFGVADVVRMGRSPWRGRPQEDRDDELVAAAMADTDVTHLADRPFPTLSGGEKSRTSLARVLAQDTAVVLLDEPTAALDLRHQQRVLALARGLAASGDAVVVVLHDLSLAAAHADRIVVMAEGAVRADGTPRAVLTEALLGTVYQHPVDVVDDPRGPGLLVLAGRPTPEESA